MDLPSSAHFIYIPGVVILGLVVGFIWGARLTRESFDLEARRVQEREKKREEKRLQRQEERRARGEPEGEANQAARRPAKQLDKKVRPPSISPPSPRSGGKIRARSK